jgi:hypothetical protein
MKKISDATGSTSVLGHMYGLMMTSVPRFSGAAKVVDPPELLLHFSK